MSQIFISKLFESLHLFKAKTFACLHVWICMETVAISEIQCCSYWQHLILQPGNYSPLLYIHTSQIVYLRASAATNIQVCRKTKQELWN